MAINNQELATLLGVGALGAGLIGSASTVAEGVDVTEIDLRELAEEVFGIESDLLPQIAEKEAELAPLFQKIRNDLVAGNFQSTVDTWKRLQPQIDEITSDSITRQRLSQLGDANLAGGTFQNLYTSTEAGQGFADSIGLLQGAQRRAAQDAGIDTPGTGVSPDYRYREGRHALNPFGGLGRGTFGDIRRGVGAGPQYGFAQPGFDPIGSTGAFNPFLGYGQDFLSQFSAGAAGQPGNPFSSLRYDSPLALRRGSSSPYGGPGRDVFPFLAQQATQIPDRPLLEQLTGQAQAAGISPITQTLLEQAQSELELGGQLSDQEVRDIEQQQFALAERSGRTRGRAADFAALFNTDAARRIRERERQGFASGVNQQRFSEQEANRAFGQGVVGLGESASSG